MGCPTNLVCNQKLRLLAVILSNPINEYIDSEYDAIIESLASNPIMLLKVIDLLIRMHAPIPSILRLLRYCDDYRLHRERVAKRIHYIRHICQQQNLLLEATKSLFKGGLKLGIMKGLRYFRNITNDVDVLCFDINTYKKAYSILTRNCWIKRLITPKIYSVLDIGLTKAVHLSPNYKVALSIDLYSLHHPLIRDLPLNDFEHIDIINGIPFVNEPLDLLITFNHILQGDINLGIYHHARLTLNYIIKKNLTEDIFSKIERHFNTKKLFKKIATSIYLLYNLERIFYPGHFSDLYLDVLRKTQLKKYLTEAREMVLLQILLERLLGFRSLKTSTRLYDVVHKVLIYFKYLLP